MFLLCFAVSSLFYVLCVVLCYGPVMFRSLFSIVCFMFCFMFVYSFVNASNWVMFCFSSMFPLCFRFMFLFSDVFLIKKCLMLFFSVFLFSLIC